MSTNPSAVAARERRRNENGSSAFLFSKIFINATVTQPPVRAKLRVRQNRLAEYFRISGSDREYGAFGMTFIGAMQ